MFCPECGALLPEGANFCARCGEPDEAVEVYDFSADGPRLVVRYLPLDGAPRIPSGPVTCRHCGAKIGENDIYCERCGRPVSAVPAGRVMYGDGGEVLLLQWDMDRQPDLTVADGPLYGRVGVDPKAPEQRQMMLVEQPMCFACGAEQEPGGTFCERCGAPLELLTLGQPEE